MSSNEYKFNFYALAVTATCDQEVFNNITYITSPSFPSLMTKDIKSCKLKIKMISSDVSQLRLDFVHFSMVSAYFVDCPAPYKYATLLFPCRKKIKIVHFDAATYLKRTHTGKIVKSDKHTTHTRILYYAHMNMNEHNEIRTQACPFTIYKLLM